MSGSKDKCYNGKNTEGPESSLMAESWRTPCRGGICAQATLTERGQVCKHLREDWKATPGQAEKREGRQSWLDHSK